MAAPFYAAIKGTTSSTPGTGAFTPSAASASYEPWSGVPSGWVGMVRFDDTGSAWERSYCYWNGTTLSRSANQLIASSTGSALSLTSSATASLVIDPDEVQPHLGGQTIFLWKPQAGSSTLTAFACTSPTATGTASSSTLASTSYLTEQVRMKYTSATTAFASTGAAESQLAAISSTSAGRGGWEFVSRWGASTLPTAPRLFVGMSSSALVGSEPSATSADYAVFAKDSTDTNIQLMTRNNTTTTKVDTGIPLVAGGWYETSIWALPGSLTIYALLIRLDTGDIWFKAQSTTTPRTTIQMGRCIMGGLSSTTGTAFVMEFGGASLKVGT